MEATQEIRCKFIDLLQTTIGFSQILQWEFQANNSFSVQILSQTSQSFENILTLCQSLVEKEHQLLSQGRVFFVDLEVEKNNFLLDTIPNITKKYRFIFIPCYYQSLYFGGFLLVNNNFNSDWTESDILLIQKLVDQYACVQYWMNLSLKQSVISPNKAELNQIEILSNVLNCNLEPQENLGIILKLIGERFEVEQVELRNCLENENIIIKEWNKNPEIKINLLLKIPVFFSSQLQAELILKSSCFTRIFALDQIQFLEKISQYISVILQQIQINKKLQEVTTKNQILEASNHNKSEFLTHINHELRTPLTGILGFSRMLQEEIYGPLNDKQKQYMQGILTSGEHLLALINDFLDISKIEANQEELFLELIAVEDICLSALSILKAKAKEQKLELKLEIGSNVNMCTTDQRRLKQILLNLLSNALKFTEVGSVTLKVENYPDKLTFSVIDTGIGIKEGDQTQLFQPFRQIHNHLSRKQKGTGLGLALSRKLAQLHGGDITLASEVGKGSCFTLHLPFQCRL